MVLLYSGKKIKKGWKRLNIFSKWSNFEFLVFILWNLWFFLMTKTISPFPCFLIFAFFHYTRHY